VFKNRTKNGGLVPAGDKSTRNGFKWEVKGGKRNMRSEASIFICPWILI